MEKTIQNPSSYSAKTVAEIVRNNYRTAAVFKQFGINYCCGGAISLQQACEIKGLDVDQISEELQQRQHLVLSDGVNPANWRLSFLVEYIEEIHHAYLRSAIPKLYSGLTAFVKSHQKTQPELTDILDEFQNLANSLAQEMFEEEETVFPYIKQIDAAHRRKESYGQLLVKTLSKPLQAPLANEIKDTIARLRQLTNNYQFADEACTNHQVMFQLLAELDRDIQHHQYLEHNILFPRAVQLEQSLLRTAALK